MLRRRFADRRELAPFLDALERGLAPDGLADLLPLVPGATVPPWRHLPRATVVLVEPEAVQQEAEGLVARAHEDRARRSEGLQPEVAEALVTPEAFAEYLAGVPVVRVREVETGGEAPARRGTPRRRATPGT